MASYDVGTQLLFENDDVRVWSLEVPPHSHSHLHTHRYKYVTMTVTGSTMRVEWEDGRTEGPYEAADGSIRWHPYEENNTHILYNDGDRTYRNFIVELLR